MRYNDFTGLTLQQRTRLFRQLLNQDKTSGFTLIEVIVSILILSLFISTAMTGLSLAVIMKVRARATAEATNWIQQDLETVRDQAARINYSLTANASAGQPYVTLASATGLVANDQVAIGTSSIIYTVQSVSGNSVRLTSNLEFAQTANSRVIVLTKCDATTPTTGFASVLQQSLPAVSESGSKVISGKPYTLTRQVTVSNTAPYEVLQLNYTVSTPTSNLLTTRMYTEVIPHAAFQCPRVQ